MASTYPTTGQAVVMTGPEIREDGEAIVARVISHDNDSFDLRVNDRGSNIDGVTLTVFHSEIRAGDVRVMRIL